jgi:hypothetical protein
MSKLGILASVFALAVGTAACGNSQGQSNSLVDVGPSTVSSTPSQEGGGNLATLGKSSGGGGGGKRGGGGTTGGSGTLSLVMWFDNNGDGQPNWNDTVTFTFTSGLTDTPTVNLTCSQNNVVVYGYAGDFSANSAFPWTKYMRLYSASWQGGAADCTAVLTPAGGSPTLATLKFTAAP